MAYATISEMIPAFTDKQMNHPRGYKGQRYVVGGCARSGTQFVARLLQRLKRNIGHEKLCPEGIVSWKIAHNNQVKQIKEIFKERTTFIHLVRNPIDQINSLSKFHVTYRSIGYEPFLDMYPYYEGLPPYEIGVWHWVLWNRLIKTVFDIKRTFRVESLQNEKTQKEFSDIFSIPFKAVKESIPLYGTKTHSKKFPAVIREKLGPPLTFENLSDSNKPLAEFLKQQASYYGYNL